MIRINSIICFSITLLFSSNLLSQEGSYLNIAEELFENSKNHWLSSEFKKKYPGHFETDNCPPQFSALLSAGSNPEELDLLLDDYEDLERKCINILLRDDCHRFIQLKALSDLYFPLFEKKLNSIGLWDDYKYLPIVLSGMNATMLNEKGKAGLWALDFVSSRKYGLRIDTQIDERKAADLSTDAALVHLKFLNEFYQEDQLKVLVAYYKSVSWTEKVIKKAKNENIEFHEALDQEVLEFLYMMDIAISVFKNLETENVLFDYIKMLNAYENIIFEEKVSFYALSKVLKLKEAELKGANPTFIGNDIPAMYRGVTFILPVEKAKEFHALKDSIYHFEKLEEQKRIAEAEKAKQELLSSIPPAGTADELVHKVRSGDNLGKIAEEYGVRVSELRDWNDVNGDMIYIGQELVVYKKKGSQVKKDTPSNSNTESKSPEKPKAEPKTSGNYIEYTVKSGESLWLISKKFSGVSADNIMEWNGIDEDIRPGQKLKIYPQGGE